MAGVDEMFQKRVPITLKAQDREERKAGIRVTVEIHTTASPIHRKDLVVTLTDEADLFFLFSLKLTEEDFQSLKMQQGLLVDFGAFPQRFIDLLEMCIQEEHKETPKFVLQMVNNGPSGTSTANLNVIETNPFKHLTHLSIKLLPGTDADVKKYLAHCLKTLKDQNHLLLERLEHTEGDLGNQLRQTREALSKRTTELDALRTEWSSCTADLKAKHAHFLNTEKEKTLQTQSECQQRFQNERRESEQAQQRVIRDMDAKCHQLDSANKELTDRKYAAEASIRELRSRLGLAEEEQQRTKTELQGLRKDNAALDHDYHEQEKEVNQLRTRLAVLEQEVRDKGEVVKRTSDLLGTEQDHKKKQEEDLDKRKRQVSKLESTVKTLSEEVIKGNEIIKKLQGDMKHYATKLKLRTQVTTEQEKLLVEKTSEMEEIRRELEAAKRHLRQREEENQKLNKSVEETMAKLDESKQLLKTNENVINWLNKQVTESQLHSHKSHGPFEMTSSSTGSFKPHTALHNFSAPPTGSLEGSSRVSRTHDISPPGHVLVRQPLVHYNPGPGKKSSIPTPIAKSSPIGIIQEEPARPEELHASPPLHGSHTHKHKEPFLDAKYFQQQPMGPDHVVRAPAHRAISPSPYHGGSHVPPTRPPLQPGRGSKVGSQDIKTSKAPLASAYFPGQTKVS